MTQKQFKAKNSKIKSYLLCLWNISKDSTVTNMKITGLNDYVYIFSVDYDVIDIKDIINIHKYIIKKHEIK